MIEALARWLGRKDRKALRTAGPTVQQIEEYHILAERLKEAWEELRRLDLAKKAIRAEIREKGRRVNSIAPRRA